MAIPVLTPQAIQQLRRDHQMLQQQMGLIQQRLRFYSQLMEEGGGGNQVARSSVKITAADTDGPSGPFEVTMLENADGLWAEGDTIEVYSWVSSDSIDPTELEPPSFRCFIEQDDEGTWWFTGQDCTEPPPASETIVGDGVIADNGVEVVYIS